MCHPTKQVNNNHPPTTELPTYDLRFKYDPTHKLFPKQATDISDHLQTAQ